MLGVSVSRQTETVQGGYGEVFFKRNGPVCLVKSALVIADSSAVGRWISVCTAPAWVTVEEDWLSALGSQGQLIGIWTIRNGEVQVYLRSLPSDGKVTIGGLVIMR